MQYDQRLFCYPSLALMSCNGLGTCGGMCTWNWCQRGCINPASLVGAGKDGWVVLGTSVINAKRRIQVFILAMRQLGWCTMRLCRT